MIIIFSCIIEMYFVTKTMSRANRDHCKEIGKDEK